MENSRQPMSHIESMIQNIWNIPQDQGRYKVWVSPVICLWQHWPGFYKLQPFMLARKSNFYFCFNGPTPKILAGPTLTYIKMGVIYVSLEINKFKLIKQRKQTKGGHHYLLWGNYKVINSHATVQHNTD